MKRIPIIVLALLTIGLPLCAQIVRIDFTATVTELQGTVPAGVSLGSSITGHVQVDLQYLPTPDDSAPWLTVYSYAGIPGYIVQFDTGTQSIALDSANAATDGGTNPGIFILDLDAVQYVNFQARNAGQTWSVTLQFRDTNAPFTLFTDNHFPYGMNLAATTDASFNYHDSGGGELTTFRADLTSVSLTLPPPPPPPQPTCITLIEQVNSSNLPERRKQPLLATLKAVCAAYDRGNCEAARGQLSAFQKKVHAQISTDDPGLANALSAAAQAIIDGGCQ